MILLFYLLQSWATLKSKAKTYNAAKVKAFKKTVNDTDIKFKIEPQMEKVLNIVGTSHKNGLNIVQEIGIVPSTPKCKFLFFFINIISIYSILIKCCTQFFVTILTLIK